MGKWLEHLAANPSSPIKEALRLQMDGLREPQFYGIRTGEMVGECTAFYVDPTDEPGGTITEAPWDVTRNCGVDWGASTDGAGYLARWMLTIACPSHTYEELLIFRTRIVERLPRDQFELTISTIREFVQAYRSLNPGEVKK
jgi:hypothetical protein